jgi:hypothetical protein
MKLNEIFFSLLVNVRNVSVNPLLHQLWVRNWKIMYLPNSFHISPKIKLWNFALYRNEIHTLSPKDFPHLLCGIESLFHPKTVRYIMNEISCLRWLEIYSSSWTTVFRCIFCNILWKFSWSLEKAAKHMNLFINEEKTKYMPVTSKSHASYSH